MKISNFRFFVRKIFQKFSISNFENGFSSWKINIFHPNFFFVQSMNGYYRFRTSTQLHNAYGRMVPKKTTQTPWFRSYRDLFANGFIRMYTIRAIPPKNAPPFYKSALNKGGGILIWGGILSRPRSQKIFACGGPKIVFLVFLKLKIFRLRRAKNHVLCVFRPHIFSTVAGTQQTWFSKTFFTGVGTRFCYSQNDLAAARMQFQVFSRV